MNVCLEKAQSPPLLADQRSSRSSVSLAYGRRQRACAKRRPSTKYFGTPNAALTFRARWLAPVAKRLTFTRRRRLRIVSFSALSTTYPALRTKRSVLGPTFEVLSRGYAVPSTTCESSRSTALSTRTGRPHASPGTRLFDRDDRPQPDHLGSFSRRRLCL